MGNSVDIASLALRVDTTDFPNAVKQMDALAQGADKLSQKAGETAKATTGLNATMAAHEKTLKAAVTAQRELEAEGRALSDMAKTLADAQKDHADRTKALADAMGRADTAAQGEARALGQLNTATNTNTQATHSNAQAQHELLVEGQALAGLAATLAAAQKEHAERTKAAAEATARAAQAAQQAGQTTQQAGTATEQAGSKAERARRQFDWFNDGLTATERAAKAAAEAERKLAEEAAGAQKPTERMTAGQVAFMESLRRMADQAGKSRTEILRMQAAELGLTEQTKHLIDEMEKANQVQKKGFLSTSDARSSLMTGLTNLAQGNLGEARQALSALADDALRAGPKFLMMAGGIIAVTGAIVGMLYLMHQGREEIIKLNNAIAMTGNYANMTAFDIERLATSMASTSKASLGESRALVTALVSSGQMSSEVIQKVSRIALDYARATGEEVDKLAPKLVTMFADPVKGAEEFSKATHGLNVTQMEHIRTLDNLGMKQQAQLALAEAMKATVPDQQRNITWLTETVNELASAWQKVAHWFKEAMNGKVMSPLDAAKNNEQAARDWRSELIARGFSPKSDEVKRAEAGIEAAEKITEKLKEEAAARSELTKRNEENLRSYEFIRAKARTVGIKGLLEQRDSIEMFNPDPQQKDESDEKYNERVKRQLADKADAQKVIDKQILDARRAMGAEGRAIDAARLAEEVKNVQARKDAALAGLADELSAAENAARRLEIGDETLYQKRKELRSRQTLEEARALEEQEALAKRMDGGTYEARLAKEARLADIRRAQQKLNLDDAAANAKLDRDELARKEAVAAASEDMMNKYITDLENQAKAQEQANVTQQASRVYVQRETIARDQLALAKLRENLVSQTYIDNNEQEIEDTKAKIAYMEREIAARTRLANALDVGDGMKLDDKNWKEVAQVAQQMAGTLGEAFGHVGEAIGGMTASLLEYAKTQHDVTKSLDEFLNREKDPVKRQEAIDQAYAKSAQAQVHNYGNMASAAKSFFKEGTTGYRLMEGAEKAFRVAELAMAIANTVKKISLTEADVAATVSANVQKASSATTEAGVEVGAELVKGEAKAATAVANQAAGGDPYTAWVRMALMAAAMAALGFAVAGGGGSGPSEASAEKVQEKQGTGSVLGDAKAKSESITKALDHLADNADLMLPLTASMAASLRAIQSGIGQIGNLAVRSGATDSSNMNLSMKNMNLEPFGMAGGAILGGLGGAAIGSAMTMTTIGEFAAGASMTALGMDLGALGGPIGMLVGALIGAVAGKLIGGTESSVTDSGLLFGGNVGQIEQTGGAQQYANIHTSSHGLTRLFSGGPSDDLKTQALSADISQQFALVFQNLDKTLQTAATALGLDANQVAAAIDQVNVATTKISLKGLSGEEITKAITDVLSKAMDDVARAAIPGLDAFIHVGEAYAETAIRVATGVEQAGVALSRFGIAAVKYTDLLDKQADVGGEITKQSIIAAERTALAVTASAGQNIDTALNAMGGKVGGALGTLLGKALDAVMDETRYTLTGVGKIIENLHGTADDIAAVYQALLDLRRLMNDTKLNGQDLGQEIITGAGGAKNLQEGLQSYLEKYFTPAEQSAAELANLRKEFEALGKTMPTTKAEFRKMIETTGTATPEAQKLTGALLALSSAFSDAIDHANGLKDSTDLRSKAESNLQAAYNKASGELNNTINRLSAWQTQLTNFGKGLLLATESPLTPEQKYTEAKRQYEDTVAKAKAGDADAQANFVNAAQAFLAASRVVNASDQQYQSDYAQVVSMTAQLNVSAGTQLNVAQQQLAMLKQQVDGILHVNESVLSVAQAIRELAMAIGQENGQTPAQAGSTADTLTALYQSVLGRAPDAAGLNYWQEQVAKGMTFDQVQGSMMGSPEFAQTRGIADLYKQLLGRMPDSEGLNYWSNFITGGGTLEQVKQAMMNSREYLDGSHATGLASVPFDGYKAELHKGEAVVDAQAMSALRRYFGGGPQQNQSSAALVAEIRALREESAKLREENAEQAAMLARVMAAVMEKNGDKVAAAVEKGGKGTAWAAQQQSRTVLK